MKKVFNRIGTFVKKNILGFILGAAFVAGITFVNADYSFKGTHVYYNNSSSGGTSKNVQGSIDDLYSKIKYGNASAGSILSGSTALVNGTKITGTMTNNGAVSGSISPGGTYTVASGYHNGTGKVTCSSCAVKYDHYRVNNVDVSYTRTNFDVSTFKEGTWRALSKYEGNSKTTKFYYNTGITGVTKYIVSVELTGKDYSFANFKLATSSSDKAYYPSLYCSGSNVTSPSSGVNTGPVYSKIGASEGSQLDVKCGIDSSGYVYVQFDSIGVSDDSDNTSYGYYTRSDDFTFDIDLFYIK